MNYIKVDEGLYLREDHIGAVRVLKSEDTSKIALRYYSTFGKVFRTNWTNNLDELLEILPIEIREDLKGEKQ